jgi:rubredoxin
MQRTDLLDTDGENKAIRSFLRFYLKPGIAIGEMRDNMESSGWDGCWPDSIGAADWNSTLTKFEAQAWLRHLFSLEQPAAPEGDTLIVRAEQLPDYARDQACLLSSADKRFEGELAALLNNPAIKVVGRLAPQLGLAAAATSSPVPDEVLDPRRAAFAVMCPANSPATQMAALLAQRISELGSTQAQERERPKLLVVDEMWLRLYSSRQEPHPLLQEPVLDVAAAAVEASADVWTGFARNDARTCIGAALEAAGTLPAATGQPIPLQLTCPECGVEHVDEGEWATGLHKTHQCHACKHEWRPYEYPTVGIAAKVDPALKSVANRIAASGGEIIKLLGFVEARAGESVETEGIHQQVAYINRVLVELSQGTEGSQGGVATVGAGVIMPRNMSEKALLLMGSAVRAALCKLTGSDGYVVKHVFGVLRAHLAEHDHEGPALGTAEHVLLPGELDDDLWRAGIEAFRKALNQRTGLDLFVARQTYQGLYDHLVARRAESK